MSFITTNVEMLLEDLRAEPHLPPALAEHRDTIAVETLEGIVRVNSIVGDLRRFASGEPAQWAVFDLSLEVASTLRIARTQLAAGQQLHAEIAPAIVTSGVARQIGQVVLNLVMNACQAIGDRGHVWVRATATDDAIEIAVTDDGIGMRSETIARVFEPFFTTRSAGDGVGLGLSVVHGIVHAHGGRIEVTSEPGCGSTFTLRLPRHPLCPPVEGRGTTPGSAGWAAPIAAIATSVLTRFD